MITLDHNSTATDFIDGINANLQDMGSVVVLTTEVSATELVTALNAEFYNVAGAEELSTDMNAVEFVEALNTNFELAEQGGGTVVKTKFRAELADTVAKVNTLDDEGGLVLLLLTDIHYLRDPDSWNSNFRDDPPVAASRLIFDDTAVNMKALLENVNGDVDAVLCLGDVIDGGNTIANSLLDADVSLAKFDELNIPLLLVLGNHDNNRNGYSGFDTIQGSDLATTFMSHSSSAVTYPSPDTFYKTTYYKDFDTYKLRLICVYGQSFSSGNVYEFSSATRTFLAESLESLPEDYKAIFVTHVPPCTKMNYNNNTRKGGESGDTTVNGVTISGGVKGIIEHYGEKVIAMLYGHCHQDNVWADPFVSIGTCCNKSVAVNGNSSLWSADAVMPLRSPDDYRQDLWDVLLVKQTAKTIDMVRFGAGVDRRVHYEATECVAGSSVTLTNTFESGGTWGLRTSDTSKASVLNGVVSVNADTPVGTLLSVWYSNQVVNVNKQVTGGTYKEYWTIKVT